MAFIIVRLKKEFGFTDWEIANFTGIPMRTIRAYRNLVKNVLESEILKILVQMNFDKEESDWRNIGNGATGGMAAGFLSIQKNNKYRERIDKRYADPIVTTGDKLEKEYERKGKIKQIIAEAGSPSIPRQSSSNGEAGSQPDSGEDHTHPRPSEVREHPGDFRFNTRHKSYKRIAEDLS